MPIPQFQQSPAFGKCTPLKFLLESLQLEYRRPLASDVQLLTVPAEEEEEECSEDEAGAFQLVWARTAG